MLSQSTKLSEILASLPNDSFLQYSPKRGLERIQEPKASTLRSCFGQKRFTYLQKTKVFLHVCQLVDQVHSASMLHHGLCPEVILVGKEGEVFVGGWQQLGSIGASLPPFQLYSAPEVARQATTELDPRSDLFSLGVIWYEWLCEQRPFSAETPLALLKELLANKVEAPHIKNPEIPKGLSLLCVSLLSLDKERRPMSALVVIELLQSVLSTLEPDPLADTPFLERSKDSFESQDVPSGDAKTLSSAQIKDADKNLPVISQDVYELKGELARGGLGKILRAQDTRLGRPVAIKEILRDRGETKQRFLREALITARLQHPSIVPVYEAGHWPTGELFYSMKLVLGKPLHQVIEGAKTLDERLALLPHIIAASEAVAYAHSEKIIHRDLKPHNILVGDYGETIVIDWGIAKDLREKEEKQGEAGPYRGQEGAGLTLEGSILGTPAYMPLEQAQGKPVDATADVYALGAILYHLFCGASPYQGHSSRGILLQVLKEPPTPLEERLQGIPRDLLAIVEKAMSREASARYETAKEFVDDLKKFQTGQIVGAYQYSKRELIGRWLRKNWIPFSAGMVVLLAVIAFLVVDRYYLQNRFQEAQRAEEKIANQLNVTQQEKEKVEASRKQVLAQKDEALLREAKLLLEKDPEGAIARLADISELFPDERMGTIRTIAADAVSRVSYIDVLPTDDSLTFVTFTKDEEKILAFFTGGILKYFDGHTGEELPTLQKKLRDCPEFQPELGSLTQEHFAFFNQQNEVWLLELGEGTCRRLEALTDWGWITGLAFSPDEKLLAVVGGNQGVLLLNVESGERKMLPQEEKWGLAPVFSPDGKYLAVPGGYPKEGCQRGDCTVRLWDLSKGFSSVNEPTLLAGHATQTGTVAFSADGTKLAAGDAGGDLQLWDLASQAPRSQTLKGHTTAIVQVFFLSQGQTLISASQDQTTRIWDLTSAAPKSLMGFPEKWGQPIFRATPKNEQFLWFFHEENGLQRWDLNTGAFDTIPTGEVLLPQLSPDGTRLLVITPKNVRLWDFSSEESTITASSKGSFSCEVSKSKDLLVYIEPSGLVHMRKFSTKEEQVLSPRAAHDLLLSEDSSLLAVAGEAAVEIWDLSPKTPVLLRSLQGKQAPLRFSPDNTRLISGAENELLLWDIKTGESQRLAAHTARVRDAAFSPEGNQLASVGEDGAVFLWNLTTPISSPALLSETKGALIFSAAYSSDGKWLAFWGTMGWKLWDRHQNKESFADENEPVSDVVFSPENSILAFTLGSRASLFDLHTQAIRPLKTTTQVGNLSFSPGGETLAAGGRTGKIYFWDIKTGEARELLGYKKGLLRVQFSWDGNTLVTMSEDGVLKLWKDDLPRDPDGLRRWLQSKKASQGSSLSAKP
jgi:WD40 repeat protein/serine/threonine protein kinase